MNNHLIMDLRKEFRGVGPFYCKRVLDKGSLHLLGVAFTVENSHDQPVIVQMQGKDRFGVVWQDIGAAQTISAIAGAVPGVLSFKITDPWDVIRSVYTFVIAPTSGSLMMSAIAHING